MPEPAQRGEGVSPHGLRLRGGQVTALLGPAAARRALLDRLDDVTARCGGASHGGLVRLTAPLPADSDLPLRDVLELEARPVELCAERWAARLARALDLLPELRGRLDAPVADLPGLERHLAALAVALLRAPVAVVVDGLTTGLGARERRDVLDRLPALAAAGAAVVANEVDPVAALAVARSALRLDADGGCVVEDLSAPVSA